MDNEDIKKIIEKLLSIAGMIEEGKRKFIVFNERAAIVREMVSSLEKRAEKLPDEVKKIEMKDVLNNIICFLERFTGCLKEGNEDASYLKNDIVEFTRGLGFVKDAEKKGQ